MEVVNLDTREKQNAFMNPARQDILRLLQLAGRPMTPKELADKMGISASSVTFHIKKLVELGVV
ncbi:winged helix-turn-helix domain-containing protein, partial [Candidatus Allofournierella excrementavium]